MWYKRFIISCIDGEVYFLFTTRLSKVVLTFESFSIIHYYSEYYSSSMETETRSSSSFCSTWGDRVICHSPASWLYGVSLRNSSLIISGDSCSSSLSPSSVFFAIGVLLLFSLSLLMMLGCHFWFPFVCVCRLGQQWSFSLSLSMNGSRHHFRMCSFGSWGKKERRGAAFFILTWCDDDDDDRIRTFFGFVNAGESDSEIGGH